MIIDGRQIAKAKTEELRVRANDLKTPLSIAVISIGADAATESFLKIKKRAGERIGVSVSIVTLPEESSEEGVVAVIKEVAENGEVSGVVVQLPLPVFFDREQVLAAVPFDKDVDFLSEESLRRFRAGEALGMPPVAGAVDEILRTHEVEIKGSSVGVVGHGKLVGEPVIAYFQNRGAEPKVFDEYTGLQGLEEMDIVVSGAGVPALIQPADIKNNVVLIDAGTSEQGGVLRGDADPACAEKASLFTPVPGGVGPITVVKLFENLLLRAA